MNPNIIPNTITFVQQILKNAEGGHDWWHIYRVWNTTKLILKTEKADALVCELGALLHDIADHKFHDEGEEKGVNLALQFLKEQGLEDEKINAILDIIRNVSFSKNIHAKKSHSIELQVVQDADRIDAIGAIGIARTFNYGGFKNRKIYDPEIKPKEFKSANEYVKSDAPTINHFYEKLLLLKDLMNTESGKKIANQRHQYMLDFLDQFHKEWNQI
ncbi:MAG: HD domain-containing protein [Bacteroidales bacterium]|nr:HD domain-containing protein [Bacteroidales bacterium]MCF8405884.1 HD domain-containing protein [Bacteroidales bacterium]